MIRLYTKNSTGIAPDGRWYAGDINALQDAVAAQSDLTQVVGLGTVQIGETGLTIFRYGTGEARLTGALRTDGILRGLGGELAGTFTTTARDSIALGSRPYGLKILNTTTNRYEWNSGSDAAPTWRSVAADGSGNVSVAGQFVTTKSDGAAAFKYNPSSVTGFSIYSVIAAEAQPRFTLSAGGTASWGPGGSTVVDVNLYRISAGTLRTDNTLSVGGSVNASSSVSGAGLVSTSHVYNQVANAVYYLGVGNDMYIQRDGTNNRVQITTNAYVPGTMLVGNIASSLVEIVARTGTQYQTTIGYSGSSAGAVMFGNPGSAWIRQEAVGDGTVRVLYNWFVDQYLTVHPYDDGNNYTAAINRSTGIAGSTFSCGISGYNNGQGAQLTATGVWTNGSSGASKENFETFGEHLAHDDVLDKIMQLPLHRYNYKASPEPKLTLPDKPRRLKGMSKDDHSLALERHSIEVEQRKTLHAEYVERHRAEQEMIVNAKHYGPTAEDFYEVFPNGYDNKTIAASDLAGVALMGVQALARRVSALEQRIN